MSDPNATHQGPSRHGGIASTPGMCELATVISAQVDRYTYTVRTIRGRALQGVPRIRMSPSDVSILPNGTTVIVRFDLGVPMIDGVIDMPADISEKLGIPTTGVTGYGGQGYNQTTNTQVGTYRGPNEPSDLVPGDSVVANHSGARVGILEGGVALLMGSGAAQVRAYSLDDLVEIISRNYRHVTDMGLFEIRNKDGRVNMSFRGASDQLNEAGADEENWTIRMDLGSEGDLFNFELTDTQGHTLFKIHADAAGRVHIFGLDGVIVQSGNRTGEPHVSEHAGDAIEIVQGDQTTTVEGSCSTVVQGDLTHTTDGNATSAVGNDWLTQAVRDASLSAGRNLRMAAAGAFGVEVRGGDHTTVVGTEAFPSPSYSVKTHRGNLAFESAMGGNIKLKTLNGEIHADARRMVFNTTTPDSFIMGGNHIVAHVAKYEPLETLLKVFFTLFDQHSHPGPNLPSATKVTPALTSMLNAIKSTRAGVGA